MECRCYRGGESRTRLKELRMTRLDYGALACTALVGAVIILSRVFPL